MDNTEKKCYTVAVWMAIPFIWDNHSKFSKEEGIKMQKNRVLYLDLIRVVCFLMVTSFHFAFTVKECSIKAAVDFYQGILEIGWGAIAVSCFFMVSGAALIYRYRDNFSLKDFYKKRFFGLYPLFWLAYLFVFLEFFYRFKTMPEAPKINFLLSIIGLDGYFNERIPTFYLIGEWFLGALLLLYLLFPLYRLVMRKCKYILPVVFLIAGIILINYNPFPLDIDQNPIMCSMSFVLGMLIEMLRESPRRTSQIGRRIAAAAGVLLFVIVFILDRVGYLYQFNPYYLRFALPIALYLILMEAAEWVRSERTKNLIATIGKHSYAYFLIHHVFLQRYIQHFSGVAMSGSNTLLLFVSSVAYIYALAVGLDKIYAALVRWFRNWRDIGKT